MGMLQARLDATNARLAAVPLPRADGWSTIAREEAMDRFHAMGVPHRRDEYWRFTSPSDLVAPEAPEAAAMAVDDAVVFDSIDRVRLVFVDGAFDADASDDPELAGVEILRLADAEAGTDWARDLYGALERRGQSPVARPFAALNTAAATDGVLIRATGRAARPVALIYHHKDPKSDAILHHLVRVEPGADLTVLENGPGAARFNTVMEVDVGDGGSFHHVRVQGRDHERRAATHMFARLGTGSVYKSFTLTANGVLTRNEQVVELTGDDGVAHIAGAALGDGRAFHHDDTVFITHDALGCESRQVFKKVLRNGATGVFQGKILVRQGAQKTDGYQISQALLLDGDSQFLAKPELEIYADDVACSHGSTSGAIDETALFYLRARGVAKRDAQDLLTLAFVAEAIEEVEDPDLAAEVLAHLEGWLARRR